VYADHFPGAPVVPGSLIIHAFMREAACLGWTVTGVAGFRFRRFAQPGAHLFAMHREGRWVRCTLRQESGAGATVATGRLRLGSAPEVGSVLPAGESMAC